VSLPARIAVPSTKPRRPSATSNAHTVRRWLPPPPPHPHSEVVNYIGITIVWLLLYIASFRATSTIEGMPGREHHFPSLKSNFAQLFLLSNTAVLGFQQFL